MISIDELDALPELGGEIGVRIVVRDGKKVLVPVMAETKALFRGPHDPELIWDREGSAWSVGTAKGVRYKARRIERDRNAP